MLNTNQTSINLIFPDSCPIISDYFNHTLFMHLKLESFLLWNVFLAKRQQTFQSPHLIACSRAKFRVLFMELFSFAIFSKSSEQLALIQTMGNRFSPIIPNAWTCRPMSCPRRFQATYSPRSDWWISAAPHTREPSSAAAGPDRRRPRPGRLLAARIGTLGTVRISPQDEKIATRADYKAGSCLGPALSFQILMA